MSFKQAERMKEVPMSKLRAIFYECIELEDEGMEVTALTLGEPDFDTPQYIKEACKEALDRGFTKYADNMGIPELREAVAQKLRDENGLDYRPGEIMVTTGVAQGMFASLMAFLDPGDEVLVPDPVYLSYADIPKIAQATVKRYKLLEENDYQIDIEEVESLITDRTKMMVIVSPSNPTGGVLTRDNLEEVSRLAAKHDLLVLSDEIYEKLVYDESRPHISIASFPGMKERTLLLNGLSKSMAMTGWRVGYIAAPAELLEPINRLCFYITAGSTSFVQYAAAIALRHQDGSVEKMRREFRKRRDYLVREINSMKHFSCAVPKGAFYVFMNIKRSGMDSSEFCEYVLGRYGLALVPGEAFGESGRGFVRMSYAASMDTLEKAIDFLKEIDDEIKN